MTDKTRELALEACIKCLETMAQKAFDIRLEGTKEWDQIAGSADIFGTLDTARAALQGSPKIEGLEEAIRKLTHPGHRWNVFMHPDDKDRWQVILEEARAYLNLTAKDESNDTE